MSNPLETVTHEPAADTPPSRPVSWYRTPIGPAVRRQLHERSDFRGALQTFGYLGTLLVTGSVAFYSAGRWPWGTTLLLVFLHGTCCAFQINAVHELGHGTVFRTRALNAFFESVFGFLGWINHLLFDTSHVRHHQYTLHPPDDLEVVLPIKILVKHFCQQAVVNPLGFWSTLKTNVRIARGEFRGEWELKLFPATDPAKRRRPVNWSRAVLVGHGLIVAGSVAAAWWWGPRWLLVPVLITWAPFYGAWLFFVCNNTQHIGLQDNVPDFRLCCRTFTVNPLVQFLYWHMNYHTEHHMYAAVPCYRLGRLHRLIRPDLPPCPAGIIATWRDIAAIQALQKTNPAYQHAAGCPNPRPKGMDRRAAAGAT